MTTAKDWTKIEQLLSEALSMTEAERSGFLEKIHFELPHLGEELESLLKNKDAAVEFFGQPAMFTYAGFVDQDDSSSLTGQQIGSYLLFEELGTGGMGAVYLAKRVDGEFDQKVAVKMLRREFNTAQIRQRFEREKNIQAALDHPNIARLLDAGTTNDGVPFLVMEYIDGETISEYCRRSDLSLEERLALFRQVLKAVSFAHRNLVIHRDLKPSNIIVTNTGQPKLLDFGISKLLSEETDKAQTVTKLGVMTPEYASPEQISGESVTTATDIFSLGVILYELVTLIRPFERPKSGEAVERGPRDDEPQRPSDAVSEGLAFSTKNRQPMRPDVEPDNDPAKGPAAGRKTDQGIIETRPLRNIGNPKLIRGDIDNIVLKALRKEPERRYETVEQFSADIRRHLDGLPVLARPATFSYRASKFIRRNKTGVIAVGLILVAIVAGLVATLWQARKAEMEKQKAEKRFSEVRSLANSILFDIYPAIEKLEGSIEARKQIVENALKYLDTLSKEASDNRGLQLELAEAYKRVGDVQGNNKFSNLGDLKGSLESYKKSESLIREAFQGESGNADVKNRLADVLAEEAFVVWWLGDNKTAYEKFDEAVALRKELINENPDDATYKFFLADLYLYYGDVPFWENKSRESEKMFRTAHESLEILVREQPADLEIKSRYGFSFNRLSKISAKDGDYEKALEQLQTGERIAGELVEAEPRNYKYQEDLWGNQWGICELFLLQEKAAEARETCPKTVETRRKMVELEPANLTAKYHLALSYGYLGRAYRMSKEYDKALETLDSSIENLDLVLKENADNIGYRQERIIAMHSKAVVYERQNRMEQAQNVFQKVAAEYEKLARKAPEDSRTRLNLFKTYADLGLNLTRQGKSAEAVKWYGKSKALGRKLLEEKALGKADQELLSRVENK